MSIDSDLNLNPSEGLTAGELAAASALTGFNLIVPEGTPRKKGVARWTEYVNVEEASRENEVSGKGAKRVVYSLRAKVIPGPGNTGDNVGKSANTFLRVNYGVLKGNVIDAGANEVKREVTMSGMAVVQLKQIVQAAGLSLDGGLTVDILEALFPLTSNGSPIRQSLLVGRHFAFVVSNDEGSKNPRSDENQQNISAIFGAPEGV